jgi:hypothetical protein
MTTLREAAQQVLEFLDAEFGWSPGEAPRIDALRAALAQQDELSEGLGPLPPTTYVLARESDGYSPERLLSDAGYTEEHMRAYAAAAVALKREAQQDEPVERGAAYGDALRWAIKACGAVQRDDGVWFGDDAAARLARILLEGISPPQQTEQERGMAQPSERTNGQQTARRIA